MQKLAILFLLFPAFLSAQVTIEGYAFETGNRGFLNEVAVALLDAQTQNPVGSAVSNRDGFFTFDAPADRDYLLRATKGVFQEKEMTVSTRGKAAGEKVFVKLEMERKPGYLLEMTLAEKWTEESEEVEAITGALIEVYNNTRKQPELVLTDHPSPTFSHTLEKGNHYTILIRKKGFFTKRLEAYVDIDGCILCMDGVQEITPGQVNVSDNLTQGLEMGSLLANVELDRIQMDKALVFENIYYDYNKANIRPDAAEELDQIVAIMRDNPNLTVELGSHTDSRGKDAYNQELSQRRAQSAVDYIVQNGNVNQARITARGYGESKLVNRCGNGVECSEAKHQKNRRTELKVTGYFKDAYGTQQSLADIMKQEQMEELIASTSFGEQYQVGAGEELPDDIREQVEATQSDPNAEALADLGERGALEEDVQTRPGEIAPTGGLVLPEEIVEANVVTTQRVDAPLRTNLPSNRLDLLTDDYSGYRIQIHQHSEELPDDHPLFTRHGNLTVERTSNGVVYLLGDFQKATDAQWFYSKIIQSYYPDAKIIRFENGTRR